MSNTGAKGAPKSKAGRPKKIKDPEAASGEAASGDGTDIGE